MKHTEFYFAMQNYITIGMLILLGIIVIGFLTILLFSFLKEKLEKFQNKIRNRDNKEGEQNDR